MSIPPAEVEAAIERYAAPLPPADRETFLEEVRARLACLEEIGPGVIARIVRDIQPRFVDQQAIGTGPRPVNSPSKYSRPNWNVSRRSRTEERWRAGSEVS